MSMCFSSLKGLEVQNQLRASCKLQYLLTIFSSKLHFVTVVCTMLKGSVYHQTLPYYCLIDSAIETSQQAFRAEEARAWGLGEGAILPRADTNTTRLIPCFYQISIVTLPSHNEPINSCGLNQQLRLFTSMSTI